MYEYNLPGLARTLTEYCGIEALELLLDLFHEAAILTGKIQLDPPHDHTAYSSYPVTSDETANHDIYGALLSAVRKSAVALVEANPAVVPDIAALFGRYEIGIMNRMLLHVIARNPASVSSLAGELLADKKLIEALSFRHEYAELALAWFPSLDEVEKTQIFHTIDTIVDRYRDQWVARFEEQQGRPPNDEEEENFRASTVRDATWDWRAVLPAERQLALDGIVAKIGDPDGWRNTLWRHMPESPLSNAELSSYDGAEFIRFLREWRPTAEPARHTVTALAQEVRTLAGQDPAKFSALARDFKTLPPTYVRNLFAGLEGAAKNRSAFAWDCVLDLIEESFARLGKPVDAALIAEGHDPSWVWTAKTGAELLKAGLNQPATGIEPEHADQVLRLIVSLIGKAPLDPEMEDFDERFGRNAFFAAEATLRGAAVELCVLYLFWLSKQEGTPVAIAPLQALISIPAIGHLLDAQLADHSPAGRVPRAILGRYLSWLFYFGEAWLRTQMPSLFPTDNEPLREAAWLGHLLNDQQPLAALMPALGNSYSQEVASLSEPREGKELEYREDRLGGYMLSLFLMEAAPADLLEQFWKNAPPRLLQHVIWELGTTLQLPPDKLADKFRARGLVYWEARLDTALVSNSPENFRSELAAIGNWCGYAIVDPQWLANQILRMLGGGFAPQSSFGLIEWLNGIAPEFPDLAVEVLEGIVRSPLTNPWEVTAQPASLRTILTLGHASVGDDTAARVQQVVSYLASVGETSFLDLAK